MTKKFTFLFAIVCAGLSVFSQSCPTGGFTNTPYAPSQPGITNFQMANINRNSANTEGNSNFVLTGQTISLTIGQTYSFSITSSNDQVLGAPLTGAPQHLRIYCDFNANNTWGDPGETAYTYDYITFTPTNAASATYTAGNAVTIPATVTPGNSKMRVTIKMGPAAGHTPPTPCNTPSDPASYHGEIEEYNVVFTPTAAATASFACLQNACTNVANTVTNNSTGAPTPTYTWSTNPAATISNVNAANPTITYTNSTTYTVTLMASNGGAPSTATALVVSQVCTGINEAALNKINASIAPNPFSARSTLSYEIESAGMTTLNIYNMLGAKVATLLNEEQNAGSHKVTIDASKFAKGGSGIYFVELTSGTSSYRSRIIITE